MFFFRIPGNPGTELTRFVLLKKPSVILIHPIWVRLILVNIRVRVWVKVSVRVRSNRAELGFGV